MSDSLQSKSGIAQGSHLAALFIVIFINDLKYVVKHSKFLLYIADLKVCNEIVNGIDLIQTLKHRKMGEKIYLYFTAIL